MLKIKVNNNLKVFNKPISLHELCSDKQYLCATCNNRLKEMSYVIHDDCEVKFLNVQDPSAMRVYETTLRFLILKALYNLDPQKHYFYHNSVSRSYLLTSTDDDCLNDQLLNDLKTELAKLIKKDLRIERVKVSYQEALDIYRRQGMLDKIDILKFRENMQVNLYKCEDYYNYLYGYMAYSSSYVANYSLRIHNPGILVSYPRADLNGHLPLYQPNVVYDKAASLALDTAQFFKLNQISQINHYMEHNNYLELINLSECMHNRELCEVGDRIAKNIRNIRLILIAGPSSSGKTTFTNRLRINLSTRGIKPVMISLDDYYKPLNEIPLKEDGQQDFEDINALDIQRFNQDMLDLIQGKVVFLRQRDNKTKEIILHGKKCQLQENSLIIIEGIHALNPYLSNSIANKHKYKIYISPLLALNIDNHSPINPTDARLLRRIVRDKKFRNLKTVTTFKLWQSVRDGEFKWIYPYADNIDFVFNSNLFYELWIMKDHAILALQEIQADSPFYIEANRLLKFLKYIKQFPDTYVPSNSIIREFIGGSSYRELSDK